MKRILLVDDHVDIQTMVAELLRAEGLHVDVCANGTEASEKLKGEKYDLIITDLIMPEENGFELIFKARNIFLESDDTPIIAITGGSNTLDFQASLQNLEHDNIQVLRKPFLKDRLLRTVHQALETKAEGKQSLRTV